MKRTLETHAAKMRLANSDRRLNIILAQPHSQDRLDKLNRFWTDVGRDDDIVTAERRRVRALRNDRKMLARLEHTTTGDWLFPMPNPANPE